MEKGHQSPEHSEDKATVERHQRPSAAAAPVKCLRGGNETLNDCGGSQISGLCIFIEILKRHTHIYIYIFTFELLHKAPPHFSYIHNVQYFKILCNVHFVTFEVKMIMVYLQ